MTKLTPNEAAHAADFTAAVATGQDKLLPVYQIDTGLARMVPVSELLNDVHKDAQALLLKACAANANGQKVMALSLLESFLKEVAAQYGVNTAEALELIADPDGEVEMPVLRRAA